MRTAHLTSAIDARIKPILQVPQPRTRIMNMKYLLAALLLVPAFAMPAMAMARANHNSGLTQAYESGREVAAPPWSFACTNDQGPRQCDQPMWVYGSPGYLARFKVAF
jgi:hypothetical protein